MISCLCISIPKARNGQKQVGNPQGFQANPPEVSCPAAEYLNAQPGSPTPEFDAVSVSAIQLQKTQLPYGQSPDPSHGTQGRHHALRKTLNRIRLLKATLQGLREHPTNKGFPSVPSEPKTPLAAEPVTQTTTHIAVTTATNSAVQPAAVPAVFPPLFTQPQPVQNVDESKPLKHGNADGHVPPQPTSNEDLNALDAPSPLRSMGEISTSNYSGRRSPHDQYCIRPPARSTRPIAVVDITADSDGDDGDGDDDGDGEHCRQTSDIAKTDTPFPAAAATAVAAAAAVERCSSRSTPLAQVPSLYLQGDPKFGGPPKPLTVPPDSPTPPINPPYSTSRRASLRQAALALQQQTYLQQRAIQIASREAVAAAAATSVVAAELPHPAEASEWMGSGAVGDCREVMTPMEVQPVGFSCLGGGSSRRIVQMTQAGGSSARSSYRSSATEMGTTGIFVPARPLRRQATPLLVRRLRVTASGSKSQLEFLDMSTAAVASGSTTGFATSAPPPPAIFPECGALSFSPLDVGRASITTTAAAAAGQASSVFQPSIDLFSTMTPFESSPEFPLQSPEPIQDMEHNGGNSYGGRKALRHRARFAGVPSGLTNSPRTTAAALLARQQTPCPLRWPAAATWSSGWEDSAEGVNEAAGDMEAKCWAGAVGASVGMVSELTGELETSDLTRAVACTATTGPVQGRVGELSGGGYPFVSAAPLHLDLGQLADSPGGPRALSRADSLSRYGSGHHPHGHPRALRVQLSLTKVHRPAVSSLVSLVPPDSSGDTATYSPTAAATATGAMAAMLALRSPGVCAGLGRVMTPTRRGRRRNLAGNENMCWDQVHCTASRPEETADGCMGYQAGHDGENGHGGSVTDIATNTSGFQQSSLQVASQTEDPRQWQCHFRGATGKQQQAGSTVMAPPPPPPPPQLQLQELADSLGPAGLTPEEHLQQLSECDTILSTFSPSHCLVDRVPSQEADPLRAVWSRASSTCSKTAVCTDVRQPSLSHIPLCRGFRHCLGERPPGVGESDNEIGSPSGSPALSPIVPRQGSGVSRLAFTTHLKATTRRASASSDGVPYPASIQPPFPSPPSAVLSVRGVPSIRSTGAAAREASRCLGTCMMRPDSVSDVAGFSATCCCGGAAAAGPARDCARRVLCHTGSVRSHAPTEDDSAESLAEVGSELGCGSEKGVDYGGWAQEMVMWGSRSPEELRGKVSHRGYEEAALDLEPQVQKLGLAVEGTGGFRLQRDVAGGHACCKRIGLGAMIQAGTVTTEREGAKAIAVAISPVGLLNLNELLKASASMGCSSRLSRCT